MSCLRRKSTWAFGRGPAGRSGGEGLTGEGREGPRPAGGGVGDSPDVQDSSGKCKEPQLGGVACLGSTEGWGVHRGELAQPWRPGARKGRGWGYLWAVPLAACGDGLRRPRAAWRLEELGKGQMEPRQEQHGYGMVGRAKKFPGLLLPALCKAGALYGLCHLCPRGQYLCRSPLDSAWSFLADSQNQPTKTQCSRFDPDTLPRPTAHQAEHQ